MSRPAPASDQRPRARRRSLARIGVTAVLLVACLGAAMDLHLVEQTFGASPVLDSSLAGACHPGLPLHVESSEEGAGHLDCVACILQLGRRSTVPAALALPAPPARSGERSLPTISLAPVFHAGGTGSRGPPAAS